MPLSSLTPATSFLLPLQRAISAKAFMDETKALEAMARELAYLEELEPQVRRFAQSLVDALRQEGLGHGMEAFLHTYGLDTSEGVALMCLAEALLRIPDAATADKLIQDKFSGAHWEQYLGQSDSFFINASSWGLLLTGKMVHLGELQDKPGAFLGRLAAKMGEPVIREALKAAMRYIGSQFVLGESVEDALSNSKAAQKKGYRFSYDILGEGARSEAQALAYTSAYHDAIVRIGKQAKGLPIYEAPNISVKLSALHPRYQLMQHRRLYAELLPRIKDICAQAMEHNISVSIDAEESTRLDIEMLIFSELFCDQQFAHWNGIGFVVQAYQKRAFYLIDYLAELAKNQGKIMPVRLVKGAYWDSEIKAAQIAGLPSYPVFTRKEHTDMSYLACAHKILQHHPQFYPQFATHNARTVAGVQAMASFHGVARDRFEFQRLHGMGETLHDLVLSSHASRIYAPIGEHKDLLAYLIRRLLENGANTSFVNLLMDEATPMEALLQNPVAKAMGQAFSPNPDLQPPAKLYGEARKNSAGLDLGNLADCEAFEAELLGFSDTKWKAASLLAAAKEKDGEFSLLHEPARSDAVVGAVREATADEVAAAIAAADNACAQWAATPLARRCGMLRDVADLLEHRKHECVALLTREAGRTIADAIAEVREAADFCRYYAWRAEEILSSMETLRGPTGELNRLGLYPRGTFACISPWNFPLAIFTGQIAAALVCGNPVIAKPAEQTPLIAAFAVRLLHEAGFPKDAVQLLLGKGETVGAALIKDPRIQGVVFTGSMETARIINQALAAREGAIVPFIAETGGQNCMLVDSSALLEQTVDDIVLSAFGSAGQRCSSLRVLYVQDDIADALIELLRGAMQELTIGNPMHFSTDIGPVIDVPAQKILQGHIEAMKAQGKLIATTPLTHESVGHFVAPHVFEIGSIKELKREVFGPILHVIRFKADALKSLAEEINGSGYGLTFGVQSRIEEHIALLCSRVKAGNMYVNRGMTGAVVGVQPFGGEGLSGTGPKAGGPHYLLRFLSERTLTVNTTAVGGNLALLSGKN